MTIAFCPTYMRTTKILEAHCARLFASIIEMGEVLYKLYLDELAL